MPRVHKDNLPYVVIEVSGGVVQEVHGEIDYDIIDWDSVEEDPEDVPVSIRNWIRKKYPEAYDNYWGKVRFRRD